MHTQTTLFPTLLLALQAQALALPPTQTTPTVTLTARAASAGGQVTAGNLATYNQANIHDGIGAGSDSYTAYGCGASSAWPAKSNWVSFV